MLELIYEYRKLTRGDTRLYKGVKETLEKLSKEYDIYLASYTQGSYSLRELEELEIRQYFTGFVFSSDLGYRKMSNNFYQKCISISGTTKENCVMIGDNKLEDMYTANNNGMKTIWVKNPITENDHSNIDINPNGEVSINSFYELYDIIETIK